MTRVESGRSAQFLDGRRHAIKWAIQYLHDRVEEMNDPNAKMVLNSAAFHMGVDAKRALPLPDPASDPRDAAFRVPPHVRNLMAVYQRVHKEIDNGKPWKEIDIGFRDGQRSTYDYWFGYMQQSLINAWESAILEDDHPSPDPRDAAIARLSAELEAYKERERSKFEAFSMATLEITEQRTKEFPDEPTFKTVEEFYNSNGKLTRGQLEAEKLRLSAELEAARNALVETEDFIADHVSDMEDGQRPHEREYLAIAIKYRDKARAAIANLSGEK